MEIANTASADALSSDGEGERCGATLFLIPYSTSSPPSIYSTSERERLHRAERVPAGFLEMHSYGGSFSANLLSPPRTSRVSTSTPVLLLYSQGRPGGVSLSSPERANTPRRDLKRTRFTELTSTGDYNIEIAPNLKDTGGKKAHTRRESTSLRVSRRCEERSPRVSYIQTTQRCCSPESPRTLGRRALARARRSSCTFYHPDSSCGHVI